MAGADSQRQLFNLIRDFATEKSQGERRVVGLKKQVEELRSELEAANADLEETKCCKESIEQGIKGYEVEFALNDTSIQTLEARISLIQDEISTVGSDLEALKNEEGAKRDEFINRMFEFNTKIRHFQETIEENCIKTSPDHRLVDEEDTEADSRALQERLNDIVAQTTMVEREYQAEQSNHEEIMIFPGQQSEKDQIIGISQLQQELIDVGRKVSLMEAIVKEAQKLQELTNSELEETCAFFGEEFQRSCVCPNCHLNNVEAIEGILQANEDN